MKSCTPERLISGRWSWWALQQKSTSLRTRGGGGRGLWAWWRRARMATPPNARRATDTAHICTHTVARVNDARDHTKPSRKLHVPSGSAWHNFCAFSWNEKETFSRTHDKVEYDHPSSCMPGAWTLKDSKQNVSERSRGGKNDCACTSCPCPERKWEVVDTNICWPYTLPPGDQVVVDPVVGAWWPSKRRGTDPSPFVREWQVVS
jgi:hypothetical protein